MSQGFVLTPDIYVILTHCAYTGHNNHARHTAVCVERLVGAVKTLESQSTAYRWNAARLVVATQCFDGAFVNRPDCAV